MLVDLARPGIPVRSCRAQRTRLELTYLVDEQLKKFGAKKGAWAGEYSLWSVCNILQS